MAFYGKQQCLVVADIDGAAYEVAFAQTKSLPTRPTPAECEAGERRFGHLRIVDHRALSVVPRDEGEGI
jgi:hypothetical protein